MGVYGAISVLIYGPLVAQNYWTPLVVLCPSLFLGTSLGTVASAVVVTWAAFDSPYIGVDLNGASIAGGGTVLVTRQLALWVRRRPPQLVVVYWTDHC